MNFAPFYKRLGDLCVRLSERLDLLDKRLLAIGRWAHTKAGCLPTTRTDDR
jgi:hypothetical protein